jgi:MFS family permease
MHKEEILQQLSLKVRSGEINQEDIRRCFSLSSEPTSGPKPSRKISHLSIAKGLYALGVVIAIIGILIFIGQIWVAIGPWGRVIVTLGFGFLMAVLGSIMMKQKPDNYIGSVFHLIGGILIPPGALILLYEFGVMGPTLWPVIITVGIIFLFYFLLSIIHKSSVTTFFAIANGTALVYLLIQEILMSPLATQAFDYYAYLTMVVGVSYLLLAQSFRQTWNKNLIGILYFFGSAGFLGGAFSQVFDSFIWQGLFFLIVIGFLFLAGLIKSRAILLVSALFLIAHLSYITGKYFADSLGWPIALVVLGLLFVGLGYVAFNIHQKYIKTDNQ